MFVSMSVSVAILAARITGGNLTRVSILLWRTACGYTRHNSELYMSSSVKPFAQPPYTTGKPSATAVSEGGLQAALQPPWEGRSIATQKFRMLEFSAFLEMSRDPETYHKHLFVNISGTPVYSDNLLEVSGSGGGQRNR